MIYVRHPRPEDFAPSHVARHDLAALAELVSRHYVSIRPPHVTAEREFALAGAGDDRVHVYIRPHRAEHIAFVYAGTFGVATHEGALALGTSQWLEPPPSFVGES